MTQKPNGNGGEKKVGAGERVILMGQERHHNRNQSATKGIAEAVLARWP